MGVCFGVGVSGVGVVIGFTTGVVAGVGVVDLCCGGLVVAGVGVVELWGGKVVVVVLWRLGAGAAGFWYGLWVWPWVCGLWPLWVVWGVGFGFDVGFGLWWFQWR
uniref:Uncharacterized protein n=1 Tax=Fagus sylvatica TaxID=28930 RepID=A0A2N9IBX0_FAGSY